MSAITLVLAGIAGYLLGSIPTGYLVVGILTGRDVRKVGSGRTGGTNAMRAGGVKAFVLTGIGDVLKGVAAVIVARLITGDWLVGQAVAGVAAVIGHNWSIFLGFKGGAGTGANIGVCIGLWPLSALWLIPLVPLGVFVVGYASITSLVIAALIPITLALRAAAGQSSWIYVGYGIAAALTVVWALRPNIKRLLAGTEPRARRSSAAQ
jgi:acyl phosphate:glycerol-3-phosphate acyltransferase